MSLFLRAAPASSLELAGAGGRRVRAPVSPRRVAPLPQPSSPRSRSSSVLSNAKPQRGESKSFAPDSVRAFAAVADVLHTVLDGSTSSEGFAQVLATHSKDLDWLTTFGSAVRELGKLIELGALGQVERQKTLMLIAAREAEARRQALESSESERDALRITAAKLAAEVDSLREQLAFHAQFSPPPEAAAPAAAAPQGMQDLRLRNMFNDHEHLKAVSVRDKADLAALTAKLTEMQGQERARSKVKLEAQARSNERLMATLQDQRHEEQRRYDASFIEAEERQDARLIEARRRCHEAQREEKLARQETRLARASAAATQQVLEEAQAEAFGLKEQLRRATIQMGIKQNQNNNIAAQLAKQAEKQAKQAEKASRRVPHSGDPKAAGSPMHAHNHDAIAGAESWPWHGQGGASPDDHEQRGADLDSVWSRPGSREQSAGGRSREGGGLEGLRMSSVAESGLLQVQAPDLGLLDDSLAESPPQLREAIMDDSPQLREAQPLLDQPFV